MQVIVTTFGGRRDRMALLVRYVTAALDAGLVTAFHVWDYAHTGEDRRWLRHLPRCHPGIRLYEPAAETTRYGSFYRHYGHDRQRWSADDVFLKLDDDIVFVDLERLSGWVAFRRAHPEFFLVSANVVNNGVCAYFQQRRGVVPASLMALPYPPRGYCGTLWERADLAERLHDYFLDDPARFAVDGTDVAPDRLSINAVAWLGRDLDVISTVCENDEEELSVTMPARLGRRNVIYQPCVAAHLSFFSQEAGMDTARLLARYEALAEARLGRRSGASPASRPPSASRVV